MSEFINTIDLLGDDVVIDSIIDRSITEFKDNVIIGIGSHAFTGCTSLEIVDCPNATSAGNQGFQACTKLQKATINELGWCYGVFTNCTSLTTLILLKQGVSLYYSSPLAGTPIAAGTGYIYVPRDYVESYKANSNWSSFANQIRAIEDYPDITGG